MCLLDFPAQFHSNPRRIAGAAEIMPGIDQNASIFATCELYQPPGCPEGVNRVDEECDGCQREKSADRRAKGMGHNVPRPKTMNYKPKYDRA
jgi:hypothetical protein